VLGPSERILVIKHGALGDFVLATGAFKAIRRHHPEAAITLLTAEAFVEPAQACGWFDAVWTDTRPPLWQVARSRDLMRRLRAGRFTRVYDLQNSDRTGAYFRLWGRPRPEWSGVARGASHRHDTPHRGRLHTLARQAEQLALAGIATVPATDVAWAIADTAALGLERPYALLVPGGSAHRPQKRWPPDHFAALASRLVERGIRPAIIGAAGESELAAHLRAAVPEAADLCRRTSFAALAALARGADLAVGNDTGPMHLIAATDCPSLVLFSAASDPARTAPVGARVRVLRHDPLAALSVEQVLGALPAAPS